MKTLKVRHEGSPRAVEGVSVADIIAGLQDGRWDPTDEVQTEAGDWLPIEEHPLFAEAAAEVMPIPRKHQDDETRLDMNPLIDVSLVLLIFFILTASYETIRKVLDMPGQSAKADARGKANVVKADEIKNSMIFVTARLQGGKPLITIESTPVGIEDLDAELQRRVRDSKKVTLLLDASPDIEYGVVMAVMDAARGAGITRTLMAQKPGP